MDITLISTDIDTWSFGLRSISATLKAAEYTTRLIFAGTNEQRFSNHQLDGIATLARQTDIVGISCLARGADKAKQLINYLHMQKKLVVWGGVHASLNPEKCADWADIVCLGEGEGMMLELLEYLYQGRDWKKIDNIAYKEDGIIYLNSLRPPIYSLDELPLPDFDFNNEYHLTSKGFVKVFTLPGLEDTGQIMYISSRGCVFNCAYCCNAKLKDLYSGKNPYIRRMSVSKLIDHSQQLQKIFPHGRYFYFIDEDFATRPLAELIQFSEEFPLKVGLPFQCMTHPSHVTYKKMDLLVKAGLFRMHMGIESGSERTRREVYNRHVPNLVINNAIEIIHSYPNIVPKYFFIIANPYEDKNDLIETAHLITSLPSGCYIQTYNLVFFPGSDLYDRAIEDGLIQGDYDSGYELDFLGGLNYKKHPWKQKNLYLNGLLFLMEGLSTRYLIGIVPRFLLNLVLRPRYVDLNEKNKFVIKWVISIKYAINSLWHLAAKVLRKILGDPTVIYNLGYHLRLKFHRLSQNNILTK